METNQEEMIVRLEVKIEAMMDSHHKIFEVLLGTFISWMDIHQGRTEANQ